MRPRIVADVSTDRYQAVGLSYPDPETVCRGECQGMGYYPRRRAWIIRWWRLALWKIRGGERPDGYDFIVCEECHGTGRRDAPRAAPSGEGC